MLLKYQEYHLMPSCSHQGSTAHQLHKPHYGVMGERAVTTCGIDDNRTDPLSAARHVSRWKKTAHDQLQ
jgi:hypothetical protein